MSLILQLLQQMSKEECSIGEQECFIGHDFTQLDLRRKLTSALQKLGLRPYFADREVTGDFILYKVCRKILATRASIVDLTTANLNVYFELGVAIGLNKPVFIVRKQGSAIPPLLENFVKLRFTAYSNLEHDLITQAPGWLEHSLDHHLLYNNHCHFIDVLCADRQRVTPQRQFFIIDQIYKTDEMQGPLIAGDTDFQSEVIAALNAFDYVPISLDTLDVVNKFRLCDYCRKIRISKFAICHLTADTTPEAYLLLGLVIGLGIPHIAVVQQTANQKDPLSNVPSMLRGLDIIFPYSHYSKLADQLPDVIEGFLNRLKSTLTIERKLPYENALRRLMPDVVDKGHDLSMTQPSNESNVLPKVDNQTGEMLEHANNHPLQNLGFDLRKVVTCACNELNETYDGKSVVLGGVINHIRTVKSKKGSPQAFVQIEDLQGQCEIVVLPSIYKENKRLLIVGSVLIFKGKAQTQDGQTRLLLDGVQNYVELAVAREDNSPSYRKPPFSHDQDSGHSTAIDDIDTNGSEGFPFRNAVPDWLREDDKNQSQDISGQSDNVDEFLSGFSRRVVKLNFPLKNRGRIKTLVQIDVQTHLG